GSATIEVGNGTQILFVGGDGGTAAWVLDPHGFLGYTGTGPIHVGSLAGDSTSGIELLSQTLVIGGNDVSTTFAGTINSSGASALVKVGTGTLTWSGTFGGSFSGPITIAGGTFDLDTANA